MNTGILEYTRKDDDDEEEEEEEEDEKQRREKDNIFHDVNKSIFFTRLCVY